MSASEMTSEERARALALLSELGIKLDVAGKMKKVASPRPHNLPRGKVPAKEYNLRIAHSCRLCGSEWDENIRMVRADLDPTILVAAEPEEDNLTFAPDKTEKRFPRSCMFCRSKLHDFPTDTLIKALMALSNRVEDAEYVRHITKD